MISDSLSPATARPLAQSTVCSIVNFHPSSNAIQGKTYDRSIQVLCIQLLHRICLIFRTLDNRASLLSSNVFENALQLVRGGKFFGHFKVEFLSFGMGLCRVIAGLILCGILRSIGSSLLQEAVNSEGSREGWLVEEGDNIEGFALD